MQEAEALSQDFPIGPDFDAGTPEHAQFRSLGARTLLHNVEGPYRSYRCNDMKQWDGTAHGGTWLCFEYSPMLRVLVVQRQPWDVLLYGL